MLLQLLSLAPLAVRLLSEESPMIEFSLAPLTAFWITLLLIVVVAVMILINALASPRQAAGYGLDQPHGDSEHGDHH